MEPSYAPVAPLRELRVEPGPLELVEAGVLTDDTPAFDLFPRIGAERDGAGGGSGRWRAMLSRLRGYRRDQVLLSDQPAWLPVAELVPPPAGSARLAWAKDATVRGTATLRVLGSGLGGAVLAEFGEQIQFTAEQAAVALATLIRVTVTRYTHRSAPPIDRVDVSLGDGVMGLREGPLPAPAELASPRYEVIRTFALSQASGDGCLSWGVRAAERATWQAEVGLAALGGGVSLGVEVGGSESIEATFELPYGRDYVIFHEAGAPRLAPRAAYRPGGTGDLPCLQLLVDALDQSLDEGGVIVGPQLLPGRQRRGQVVVRQALTRHSSFIAQGSRSWLHTWGRDRPYARRTRRATWLKCRLRRKNLWRSP